MNSKDSLTRRAGLTFISQLLQQGARFIVGLVVTPIIIRGLGAELYGAWTMIQQTIGYLSLSDLRPMGTLKFTLAVTQHLDDVAEKRRQIGSALLIWVFSIPVFLILGSVVVWKIAWLIRVSPGYIYQVQLATAIVVVSAIMDRIVSLPANVLRGVNLEYKAMGLNAAITLLSGGLLAIVIWFGWGLPGVAGASVLGLLISGVVRLVVAINALTWFGVATPHKQEFIDFAKLTLWLTLSGLSGLLLTASDFLLVGFLLGPAATAVYATTGAVLRMTTEPLAQILSAASPGLAGICGQGDWKRALAIRSEMFMMGIAGMVFLGAGTLALNKTFISLWVGQEYFGGQVVNLCLVLAAISKFFFRIDNTIIAGMLEIKRMALSMLICGVLVIVIGWGLIPSFGLVGMTCATLIGYSAQWGYYQFIIRNRSGFLLKPFFIRLARPVLAAIPALCFACLSFRFFHLQAWLEFFAVATGTTVIILGYIGVFLLSSPDRNSIMTRVKSFIY